MGNKCRGAGQQGLQATGAMAGLQQGMGDIESGYGQQMAGTPSTTETRWHQAGTLGRRTCSASVEC